MGLPPSSTALLLGLMAFFGLYMVYEVWAWFSGNRAMLTPGQFRRRLAGGILLEMDMALWFFAHPALKLLHGFWALEYLLLALLLVFLPIILAVREAAFVVRQYARWRSELVRNLGSRDQGSH